MKRTVVEIRQTFQCQQSIEIITISPSNGVHILHWRCNEPSQYIIDLEQPTSKEIQRAFYIFGESGLGVRYLKSGKEVEEEIKNEEKLSTIPPLLPSSSSDVHPLHQQIFEINIVDNNVEDKTVVDSIHYKALRPADWPKRTPSPRDTSFSSSYSSSSYSNYSITSNTDSNTTLSNSLFSHENRMADLIISGETLQGNILEHLPSPMPSGSQIFDTYSHPVNNPYSSSSSSSSCFSVSNQIPISYLSDSNHLHITTPYTLPSVVNIDNDILPTERLMVDTDTIPSTVAATLELLLNTPDADFPDMTVVW